MIQAPRARYRNDRDKDDKRTDSPVAKPRSDDSCTERITQDVYNIGED